MTFVVTMTEAARIDLADRHTYIKNEAGDALADRYVQRVDARIRTLDKFPERGTPRPALGSEVRALSFERRLLIVYRVEAEIVRVLRILDAVRDFQALDTL